MENRVIVNADDFALTKRCSLAIAKAFEENLISSTTACVNGEFIEQGVDLAKEGGFYNNLGIHLNLTEGKPLTKKIRSDPFFCTEGTFHGKIDRLKKPTSEQLVEIKDELTAQIEKMLELGYSISHADSHHHIHTCLYFEDTISDLLFSYNINKIRLHRNVGKIAFYKKLVKNWYNKKLTKQGFTTTKHFGSVFDYSLDNKPLFKGTSEIMVHPDFTEDGKLIDRTKLDDNGLAFGKLLNEITLLTDKSKLISYRDL